MLMRDLVAMGDFWTLYWTQWLDIVAFLVECRTWAQPEPSE